MKEISIIIVSYNEKQFLKSAIESCMMQDGIENYEIIIGDDGSSDGSIEIIQEYQKKYPECIRSFVMERGNEQDIIAPVRVSNVIRKAAHAANGRYLMMMSADDLMLGKTRLQTQLIYLKKHDTIAGCYTDFKLFWEGGRSKTIKTTTSLSGEVMWGIHYVHISCFLFKREVISNFLSTFCDDTGALFSIIKTGKIDHIDFVGFAYRQREKSITYSSDQMELSILELLLYQDVLNAKGYRFSSLSRFSRPLRYILKNRNRLSDVRYQKYRRLSASKQNDLLTYVCDANDNTVKWIKLEMLTMFSVALSLLFRVRRRAQRLKGFLLLN